MSHPLDFILDLHTAVPSSASPSSPSSSSSPFTTHPSIIDHAISEARQTNSNNNQYHAASSAPLTLIEDSLDCTADFLFLHTLSHLLTSCHYSSAHSSSAKSTVHQSPTDPQQQQPLHPAVLLCAWKQTPVHYSYIAKKWGISFPNLESSNYLYILDKLPTSATAFSTEQRKRFFSGSQQQQPSSQPSPTSSASATPAEISRWFGVEGYNITGDTERGREEGSEQHESKSDTEGCMH